MYMNTMIHHTQTRGTTPVLADSVAVSNSQIRTVNTETSKTTTSYIASVTYQESVSGAEEEGSKSDYWILKQGLNTLIQIPITTEDLVTSEFILSY